MENCIDMKLSSEFLNSSYEQKAQSHRNILRREVVEMIGWACNFWITSFWLKKMWSIETLSEKIRPTASGIYDFEYCQLFFSAFHEIYVARAEIKKIQFEDLSLDRTLSSSSFTEVKPLVLRIMNMIIQIFQIFHSISFLDYQDSSPRIMIQNFFGLSVMGRKEQTDLWKSSSEKLNWSLPRNEAKSVLENLDLKFENCQFYKNLAFPE